MSKKTKKSEPLFFPVTEEMTDDVEQSCELMLRAMPPLSAALGASCSPLLSAALGLLEHKLMPSTRIPSKYASLYVGVGGLAFAWWRLGQRAASPATQDFARTCFLKARDLLTHITQRAWNRLDRVTFLEGKPGIHALLCAVNASLVDPDDIDAAAIAGAGAGEDKKPSEALRAALEVCRYHDEVATTHLGPDECELLYGRVGFLYALLFALKACPAARDQILATAQPIVAHVLHQGRQNAHKAATNGSLSLVYFWHDTLYLGGVHGICGILNVLLLCHRDLGLLSQDDISLVLRTAREVKALCFPSGGCVVCCACVCCVLCVCVCVCVLLHVESIRDIIMLLLSSTPGNLPSSFGREADKLVQFCHGACGWALFCVNLVAYVESDEEKSVWMDAARAAADVIRERGLLCKVCQCSLFVSL
jgi:hypothetical protein